MEGRKRLGRGAAIWIAVASSLAAAQEPTKDDRAETTAIDRFVSVLEKNPRRGTAFDKVYDYHAERGSLADLLNSFRRQAANEADGETAAAWMIVGLIESRRGNEALAAEAFQKSESIAESNPLAPFYLGQSKAKLGQWDQAAAAFERAIARMPPPADLLDIYQSLGRVYQRTHQSEKGLAVWNRLERQFPNDPQVREQIANVLVEEGDYAAAVPRIENLARTVKDPYRQLRFRIEAGDLKLRLNRTDEALADLEKVLTELNPDHWMFRDVRRRIEGAYLRNDNSDGLIAYYERWLRSHPDDMDAVSRLAGFLVQADRMGDARSWLERGLRLAPSRRELRQSLINQLLYERNFATAIKHFELLDKFDPNNPDTLRNWGRAILQDESRDIDVRRRECAAIWHRLTASRPQDALVAAQTAELFRHADMIDQALELYARAIALAPDSIPFREYLGEYLHSLKRTDPALVAWREIATGSRRNVANVVRLAEVLANFGYFEEAIEVYADACGMDSKDFSLKLKRAELLMRTNRHDDALQLLATIESLASNDEERDAWLKQDLAAWKASGRLSARVAEVQRELEIQLRDSPRTERQTVRFYWLARAAEADGQWKVAESAIQQAQVQNPQSIRILTAAARISVMQRNLAGAIVLYRKLADLDERLRIDSLMHVAELERTLGRRKEALEAGRELFAVSQGNPRVCDFYARLCLQLGNPEDAIQAFRQSLKSNPGDLETLIRLAAVLIDRSQTEDAIELLWRAFERSKNLDHRVSVVQSLATAYSKSGQLDRLLSRLERQRRDPTEYRDLTICLARAQEASGDLAAAQRSLESLLTEESRDLPLLTYLRDFAERRYQLSTAIRCQQQILRITNDQADRLRLSQLLVAAGSDDEADQLLAALDGSIELNATVLKFLDSLYEQGRTRTLLVRVQRLRERYPDNWELQYREAIALAGLKSWEAIQHFEAILANRHADDETSLISAAGSGVDTSISATRLPLIELMSRFDLIRQATNFAEMFANTNQAARGRPFAGAPMGSPTVIRHQAWMPHNYGEARFAAWGWLLSITSNRQGQMEEFVARHRKELDSSQSRQSLVDRIAIQSFLYDVKERFSLARQLVKHFGDETDVAVFYLSLFGRRTSILTLKEPVRLDASPLEDEVLAEGLEMYRSILDRPDLIPCNVLLLNGLAAELRLAGQEERANKLVDKVVANVTTREEVAGLFQMNFESPQFVLLSSRLLEHLIAFEQSPSASVGTGPAAAMANPTISPNAIAERLSRAYHRSAFERSDVEKTQMLECWRKYLRWHSFHLSRNWQPIPTRRRVGGQGLFGSHVVPPVAEQEPGGLKPFLRQAGGFCPEAMILLWNMRYVFLNSHPSDPLTEAFQQHAKSAEISANERLLWEQGLAFLLWNDKDFDAALAVLSRVVERYPDRADMRVTLAAQYELADHPAEALTVLDSVPVTERDLQLECERLALRLALDLGRTDRAKDAAKRLFGLQVPAEEVFPLAVKMVPLGLLDEASALMSRIPNEQRDFLYEKLSMDLRLAQGNLEQATVSAEKILEQLREFRLDPSGFNRAELAVLIRRRARDEFPFEFDDCRRSALKVLKQADKLPRLIEKLESELAKSSRSHELLNWLIACHTVAGDAPQVQALTDRLQQVQKEDEIRKKGN